MDGVFTPIFVVLIICLLLESLSLVLYDFGMALCLRIIMLLLLYLTFVIKRRKTLDGLRKRSDALLRFRSYIILYISLSTLFTHIVIAIFRTPFRTYCGSLVLLSLLVTLEEYMEIIWLQTIESQHRQQADDEPIAVFIELRDSIYYTVFATLLIPMKMLSSIGRESSNNIV